MTFNRELKPLLLVFPHDLMAHYLRCLQLSTYLRPYFEIRFLYSACFHSFVTDAGFETFNCAALNAEKVQQCMLSFDFSWLNEKELYCIYQAQVKIINELKPAAVLSDMCPTLKMAAEKTGVFHFSVINAYMSNYYANVRRMPRRFPLYKLFNLLPASMLQHFTHVGEQIFFRNMHRPFRKIRKQAALSERSSYMQEAEGDVNLVCDLPELFPLNNPPANYHFIPPLYARLTHEDDKIIEALDRTKKTLYVSMGSSGSWEKMSFLNNAAFLNYNIVTTGDTNKVVRGPNVFCYSFISSDQLFDLTDLVICHGGNGTVYQALSHGIPVLCKTAHVEQEYNVDGLERLQLGKSLDDISNNQDYLRVVQEWIEKKNSKELVFIKNKILEANNKFEQIIEDLLKTHFLNEQFAQSSVEN